MARKCDVCQKGSQWGHKVSHAHNVSKRRWFPNLQTVRAIVDGKPMTIRACTRCLRSGKVRKNVTKPAAAAVTAAA
jgi:large subunit ribosomal protein L28